MRLEIFGSRILILCDEMAEKVGSIIMPNKHSERTRTAMVLAVGDAVKNYKEGDRVILSWYTGVHLHLVGKDLFGIAVDEDRHRFVREDEILGKIIED